MLAAFCLLWRLAQEIPAAGKLPVKLVVQVVPVCDDDNGRAFQGGLQRMGVKYHRQRLPAALGMPEHAAFAVCNRCFPGGLHRFFDRKILMVAR